jgi:hypothetical protein
LSLVPALSAILLSACSVDERHLELAADAGSVDEGGAGVGGAGASSAGKGGNPSGLVDGCADLDTDGVADCTTTLVQNPSFATDVSAWSAGSDSALSWDTRNALSDLPSGSAKLSSATPRASAVQCVAVPGAELVIAYASALVEAVDSGADSGQAQLEVSFFADGACGGTRVAYFTTPAMTPPNTWATVQAGSVAPVETGSASIELVGLKPDAAAEIDVYFDNVMVKTKAP